VSAEQRTGYAYRLRPPAPRSGVAAAKVLEAARLIPAPRWSFLAASLWDAVEGSGRANLHPIAELPTDAAPNLRGDFGHIFGEAAELRWRRRDDGSYEALLLTERPLNDSEATDMREIGVYLATRIAPAANELLELAGAAVVRSLSRVEYRDRESLALRFVRYRGANLAQTEEPA